MHCGREADLSLHHEGPVHAEVVHHSVHVHGVLHLHLLDQPVDGDERARPPHAGAATTPTGCLCFLSNTCSLLASEKPREARIVPPNTSAAQIIKALAAQRGGSYHHQEGLLSLACAQDYIYKLLKGHLLQLSFPP